ncbi:ubiquitin carrier protein [Micromonas commoda]|uniref:E2 ubiquitin-conjugating enzyme n=1 Tax=Micromonas commoda (strain RCC299 / NOUM17 / CCMP2709) TaxID=296587 RepID=C1FDP5_MICCC|nr:ubiquitin carrier protein [Micromonas commoda]ACO68429.1 ubiquitin carrier protein [Micromonas commoda]|eukprot:XP_002507171.1 ubiquitin carrier protein [Micromonas commoda]
MDGNLSRATIRFISKQLKELHDSPPEGINVLLSEENITEITAEVEGPADTPFHGGTFKMRLILPHDYPEAPPKGFFVTKIFHPNIRQPGGEICVNTLKKDWQPSHSLRHVLMVIRCLLIEPFPESALNEEAAKLLLEDYDEYFRRAKMLTSIYASTLGHAESCAKSSESSKAVLKGNMKHKKKSLRRL